MDLRLSRNLLFFQKIKINALKIMEQKFNLFKTEPKHTYNIKKEDMNIVISQHQVHKILIQQQEI